MSVIVMFVGSTEEDTQIAVRAINRSSHHQVASEQFREKLTSNFPHGIKMEERKTT